MKLTILFIIILLTLFVTGTIKAYQSDGFNPAMLLMGLCSLFLFIGLILSFINL